MFKFGKPTYQPMTAANFIALAQKRYSALQALNKIDNFYERNLSDVAADRRKKKLTKFGRISINKTIALAKVPTDFK